MPRNKSPRPLQKVTLNLFKDNIPILERAYGRGWSERVRELVDQHVGRFRASAQKRTVEQYLEGDFE